MQKIATTANSNKEKNSGRIDRSKLVSLKKT